MAKKAYGEVTKDIVHIAGVDLNGHKPIYVELRKVVGVNWMFAHAVCAALGIDKWRKIGSLTDEELEKLEDALRNPQKYGIPSWLYDRRRDPETGEDKHLVGDDYKIAMEFDIKREMEINSWRGYRHREGLPVRGQRTRSHHRKGRTVGVIKSKK